MGEARAKKPGKSGAREGGARQRHLGRAVETGAIRVGTLGDQKAVRAQSGAQDGEQGHGIGARREHSGTQHDVGAGGGQCHAPIRDLAVGDEMERLRGARGHRRRRYLRLRQHRDDIAVAAQPGHEQPSRGAGGRQGVKRRVIGRGGENVIHRGGLCVTGVGRTAEGGVWRGGRKIATQGSAGKFYI